MKIEVGERGGGARKKSGEWGGEKRLKGGDREGKGVREGGGGGVGSCGYTHARTSGDTKHTLREHNGTASPSAFTFLFTSLRGPGGGERGERGKG